MQVEVTPERMEEIQKAFRNKKPIIWKGKKYLVQSGGEINYHNDTKTWHTDLTLRLFEKKVGKENRSFVTRP